MRKPFETYKRSAESATVGNDVREKSSSVATFLPFNKA
jgi:hypothetical protein